MKKASSNGDRGSHSFKQEGLQRISAILEQTKKVRLENLNIRRRNQLLGGVQASLDEYTAGQPVRFSYDPSQSTWQSVCNLLDSARKTRKEGPVARYLVGAKLQLRFPDREISNELHGADIQLGRRGSFYVEDTVFHVTVAPMAALYEKCKSNIDEGFKVYVIVPDRLLVGTKQNSDLKAGDGISVCSVESFVSQTIDELSGFSPDEMARQFLQLLEVYNKRVDAIEANKSMMVEIPVNLYKLPRRKSP